jgi:ubiquinone biosynthesis accessory factor UbiJ
MIANLALLPIEKAINAFLAMDEATLAQLTQAQGKVIKLNIKDWCLTGYCTFSNTGVTLSAEHYGTIDTTVTGTLFGLFRVGVARGETTAAFGNGIEITGDTELGQQLQHIFQHMDIDWEEQLSNVTSDRIAHRTAQAAKKTQGIIKQTSESITEATLEYVHEEAQLLPTKDEVDHFTQQVRDTRDAVDRLEARIQFMNAHTAAQP